jgi:hypothetical protein
MKIQLFDSWQGEFVSRNNENLIADKEPVPEIAACASCYPSVTLILNIFSFFSLKSIEIEEAIFQANTNGIYIIAIASI